MTTFYLSTDIETDGMCPIVNSMISLGAVMLDEGGKEVGSFSANLRPLPEAVQDPDTMAWWAKHPEAYAEATDSPWPASQVMAEFRAWVESFGGDVVFIGYPVTFDFTFVWVYLYYFTGGAPFVHGGLDIKTMAAVALGVPYTDARRANWPERWVSKELQHNHVAVDDARDQAYSFVQIRKELEDGNSVS